MKALIFLITSILFTASVLAYDFSDEECAQVSSQMNMDYGTFNSTYTPYYTGQPYTPAPITLPVNPQSFASSSFVLQTNQTNLFTDPHQFAPRDPMRLRMGFSATAEAWEHRQFGQGTIGRGKWTDWNNYLGPIPEKNIHSLSPKKFKHKKDYIKIKLNSVPSLRIDKQGKPYSIYSDIQFYRINDHTFRVNDRGQGVHEIILPQGVSWYNLDKLRTPPQIAFAEQMQANQKGLLTHTTLVQPSISPTASGLKAAVIFQGLASTNRIPHWGLRVNDNIFYLKRIYPPPCADLGKPGHYDMDIPYHCREGKVYSSGNKVTYSHFTDYSKQVERWPATPVQEIAVNHLSKDQVHALHTNLFNSIGQNGPHDSSSNFIKDQFGKLGAAVPQNCKFDTPVSAQQYLHNQGNYSTPANWREIGHNFNTDTYLIPTNWYSPQLEQRSWDKTTPAQPFLGPFDR